MESKTKAISPEGTGDFLAAHEDVVKRVLERQPADEYLYELAELFKVFGDSTRIKILYALFESDLCVGDLAQLVNISQSAVSHQLKILSSGFAIRRGRTSFPESIITTLPECVKGNY